MSRHTRCPPPVARWWRCGRVIGIELMLRLGCDFHAPLEIGPSGTVPAA